MCVCVCVHVRMCVSTFRAVVVLIKLPVLSLLLPPDQVIGLVSIGSHGWGPAHNQLRG